jgi:hypothetical protein
LGIDYVSAWAGIHYFAGRKTTGAKNIKIRFYMAGRKCKTGKTFFKIYRRKNFPNIWFLM